MADVDTGALGQTQQHAISIGTPHTGVLFEPGFAISGPADMPWRFEGGMPTNHCRRMATSAI